MRKSAEYLVVGSGAGGGTVARELALRGAEVIVLERGRKVPWAGNHLFAVYALDGHGFLKSEEGMGVARAITTGGSTVLTCGTAARPPAQMFEKNGIELEKYLDEAEKDLKVCQLPDEIIGEANLKLMEVGNRLGMKWKKLDKFIDPEKCKPHFCNCMLGCSKGAKWTSRNFLDEAARHGAEIIDRVKVEQVMIENNAVSGVRAWRRGEGEMVFEAEKVILSAGGIGTPVILKNSGLTEAGYGFFCDPLVFTIGFHPKLRPGFEPPMTVGTFDFWESEGFLLSPVVDPWISFGIEMLRAKPSRIYDWARFPHAMGIMTKSKDTLEGTIFANERFSKNLTLEDKRKLDKGIAISRRMLIEAGCHPDSIWVTKPRGAHPGGTCRIGDIVNSDLETEIKNLYVCDASVIPDSLAAPVVITLVALGKRLADKLEPVS